MTPKVPSRSNLTPRQAVRLQERLRDHVILEDRFDAIRFDVSQGLLD